MPELERKKKMISIRLSNEEYAVLKSQYRTHGARNISDLARLALQQMMHSSAVTQSAINLRVADLEDRVHALECEVSIIRDRTRVILS